MKLTKEYLSTLTQEERKETIVKEYIRCKTDVKYCIETYFTVMAGTSRIPFKLFPHQVEMIDSYEDYNNSISLKTRQMGFSTGTSAWLANKISFNNNFKVVIISKTKTDSKEFLRMVKDILNEARKEYPWLIPPYMEGYNNKESIMLTTGSLIKAEAATEDAGRGTPGLTCVVIDECAFIDRKSPEKMREIWGAVSPALASVKGKAIIISTPKGSSGWYFESFNNAKKLGLNVIDAHWSRHPIYNQGMYQWVFEDVEKTKGHLEFLSSEWPETIFDRDAATYIEVHKDNYPFVYDGKIRSPWYDMESTKLGPRLTSQELDCQFVGTGGEVFDPEILRDMKLFSDSCSFSNPFEHLRGIYKNYREYKAPIEGHKYLLSADVATGDGSDHSAFTVIDMTALELVATYKEQLLTTTYANIISRVGKRYFNSHVVVENAGGGETTLQELKRKNYPHIYYSTLQKKDPSTGVRKRKIGLWASESVRWQGGDRLEEVIRLKQLLIPDEYLVSEFFTWIWDKDGKRRHAPEKNDDIIMALQHGIWYFFYVYQRSQKNRNTFKKSFEIRRNGEEIKMTDNLHGRGTMIKDQVAYTVMPGNATSISGNIDKMIDARIMSPNELSSRKDRVRYAKDNDSSSGRRTYI